VAVSTVEAVTFLPAYYFSWLLPFSSFGHRQVDFVVRVVVKSGGCWWWGVCQRVTEAGTEGRICLAGLLLTWKCTNGSHYAWY